MEGTSMLYSFSDAAAPERHELQYFEMFGNRGIYYKGWSAVTKHRTPWLLMEKGLLQQRPVGAYDGSKDWTRHDLSKEMPTCCKLHRLWLIEAHKHNVLLMDDRTGDGSPRSGRTTNAC
jgi:arylsulfatase